MHVVITLPCNKNNNNNTVFFKPQLSEANEEHERLRAECEAWEAEAIGMQGRVELLESKAAETDNWLLSP
jgi:hypothetical protein